MDVRPGRHQGLGPRRGRWQAEPAHAAAVWPHPGAGAEPWVPEEGCDEHLLLLCASLTSLRDKGISEGWPCSDFPQGI